MREASLARAEEQHARAMYEHAVHRLAAASVQICDYKSVLDDPARGTGNQEEVWLGQLEAADNVCICRWWYYITMTSWIRPWRHPRPATSSCSARFARFAMSFVQS